MSESDTNTQQSATPVDGAAQPPVTPSESAVDTTQFDGLTVSVRRNESQNVWEAYVTVGGAEWVVASRRLGGFDDDLQEAATPGFKEKRRLYYEREVLGLR